MQGTIWQRLAETSTCLASCWSRKKHHNPDLHSTLPGRNQTPAQTYCSLLTLSYKERHQMVLWQMTKSSISIKMWSSALNLIPYFSLYRVPLNGPNFSLLFKISPFEHVIYSWTGLLCVQSILVPEWIVCSNILTLTHVVQAIQN